MCRSLAGNSFIRKFLNAASHTARTQESFATVHSALCLSAPLHVQHTRGFKEKALLAVCTIRCNGARLQE